MKKYLFITTAAVFLIFFSYNAFVSIKKNEVLRTGIKYVLDDITSDHPEKGLLIGSSSLRYMNYARHLHCGTWLNRGIGGAEIPELSRYVSFSPLSVSPEIIVVYAGENDVSRGVSPEKTAADYIRLLTMLRAKFPAGALHVIAIKPSPARRAYWEAFFRVNNAVQTHVREMENAFFHPENWSTTFYNSPLAFAKDGIHLTDEGYEYFVKEINILCR